LEFQQNFKVDLFEDYGNISKYTYQKRHPVPVIPLEPYEKEYIQESIKELTALMSDEWFREGELIRAPIWVSYPPSLIHCRIRGQNVRALYNPAIGANIMSNNFALAFLGGAALTPTCRTVKGPSGSLIQSYGVIQDVSIRYGDVKASLDFHVFEVPNFDVLIGHPIEKLLTDAPNSGSLSIRLGKETIAVPIIRTQNSVAEISPIIEPMAEVLEVNLIESSESTLEEEAEEFIKEEADFDEILELPKFEKPTRPPIELKPLPSGLRYAFLNNDVESPVVISDKLSEEETSKRIAVLEKASSCARLYPPGSQGHQPYTLYSSHSHRSYHVAF